jgi:hypothetical protein
MLSDEFNFCVNLTNEQTSPLICTFISVNIETSDKCLSNTCMSVFVIVHWVGWYSCNTRGALF